MSATVIQLQAINTEDEALIAVPSSHLRRLLDIERAAIEALNYRRPSGAISPSQAKRLRTAIEGTH